MATGDITIILLITLIVFTYLGLMERVLERMGLTQAQALILLLLLVLGGGLPAIYLTSGLALNIGGMIVPAGICVYLLIKAETRWEKIRALLAALFTAIVVSVLERVLPLEPGFLLIDLDTLYFPPLVAGLSAYLLGRSRRASFIAGVLGVIKVDFIAWIENVIRGLGNVTVELGGGGVFGGAVLAGMLAVLLAELIGEIKERLLIGGG